MDQILTDYFEYYGEMILRKDENMSLMNSTLHKFQIKPVEDKTLTPLSEGQRVGFFAAYIIIFIIAITANIATIIVTVKRKMRSLQKTSTISLAVSDIVVVLFHGGNNIIMLSHPMNNWILGEFMCAFVPYMQNTGQIANSITMAMIAFDRYRSIVHSLNKQWVPNKWICGLIFFGIWIVPAGISLPQFKLSYLYGPVLTFHRDPNNPSIATSTKLVYLCQYSQQKDQFLVFYTLIGCIIFLPSMFLFLWLYFKIAQLIWRRRQSPTAKYENSSVTQETSVGDTKSLANTITPGIKRTKSANKRNRIHMERKIRTFKIILVIMIIFFLCRMPHWINNVIRFAKKADGQVYWLTSYILSFLVIVNTAINPFLYSFLNQTIAYFDKFFKTLGDCVIKICCCCCSEFDDYEREKSIHSKNLNEQINGQNSNVIPRGPYPDCSCKSTNRVKFTKTNTINTYPSENDKPIGYGVI